MTRTSGQAAIQTAFERARASERAALIPFLTAGFPTLAALPDLIKAAEDAGADVVEIGIPFSDPLADGPVLQRAASEALAHGTRVDDILAAVARLPKGAPRVFLTYINPVLRRGYAAFADEANAAGMSGAIIPDLPWSEATPARKAFQTQGLALIPLVAPTSTDRHLKAIESARGFVYAVSVTGVTGAREGINVGVASMVERIRRAVNLPVAIGFGISTPEQVKAVGAIADGVIVGSALTQALMHHRANPAKAAYEFLHPMRRALDRI